MKSILSQSTILDTILIYLDLRDIINLRFATYPQYGCLEIIRLINPITEVETGIQIFEINSLNVRLIDRVIPTLSRTGGKLGYNLSSFLDYFIRQNDLEMVDYLFELGINPNQFRMELYVDEYQDRKPIRNLYSQLFTQVVEFGSLDMVKLFLKCGANPNIFLNGYVEPPLYAAIRVGNTELTELLLDYGADPNYYPTDIDRRDRCRLREYYDYIRETHHLEQFDGPPIFLAILINNHDIVKLLIDKGADIKCIDEHGYTPLMRSGLAKSVKLVKLLLSRGAPPILDPNMVYDRHMGEFECSNIVDWSKTYGIKLGKLDVIF